MFRQDRELEVVEHIPDEIPAWRGIRLEVPRPAEERAGIVIDFPCQLNAVLPIQAVRIHGPVSGKQHGVLEFVVGEVNTRVMFQQVLHPVTRVSLQDLLPGTDILSDPSYKVFRS